MRTYFFRVWVCVCVCAVCAQPLASRYPNSNLRFYSFRSSGFFVSYPVGTRQYFTVERRRCARLLLKELVGADDLWTCACNGLLCPAHSTRPMQRCVYCPYSTQYNSYLHRPTLGAPCSTLPSRAVHKCCMFCFAFFTLFKLALASALPEKLWHTSGRETGATYFTFFFYANCLHSYSNIHANKSVLFAL